MSLEEEITQIIINATDLDGVNVADIDPNAPLFDPNGVGLDSIDSLEIGLALKKQYNVQFTKDADINKQYFYSVATLAEYISKNK